MCTQIYLTEDQRAAVAAIASQSGKRQSAVIREVVDRFIEHEEPRPARGDPPRGGGYLA